MNSEKQINVRFTDTFDGTAQFIKYWLIEANKFHDYSFNFDTDQLPKTEIDLLFFGDENFGQDNLTYNPERTIRIFFTGENRRWYNYHAHFGLTFDHIDDDRHFRLPLYLLNIHYLKTRFDIDSYKEYERRMKSSGMELFNRKSCGYVQSNPNCEMRNQFFDKLDLQIFVHSAGPHKNNTGFLLPRDADGLIKKLDFLRKHKFTMAFENGSYPGYATEKLLEAYLAGTVPIYWGSPTIDLDFNSDAFLNWHDFKNDDDFLNRIKYIHNNDAEYLKITRQRLFKPDTLNKFRWTFEPWFKQNVLERCFKHKKVTP